MADGTKIEWADSTWNIITGCSVVSAGCTNCYAMKLAGTRLQHHPSRAGLTRESKAGPVWTGDVRFNEGWFTQPLQWKKPRRIFVCAHGDLFHESVPNEWIDKVFAVMALTPHHTYQVLTKRPDRLRKYISDPPTVRRVYELACDLAIWGKLRVVLIAPGSDETKAPAGPRVFLDQWPLPNLWLGTSVEDQARADERIPLLVDTPAAVRWISAEPLLGSVDLKRWLVCASCADEVGAYKNEPRPLTTFDVGYCGNSRLNWVVVGGESGIGSRPMNPDWVRNIRNDCAAAGVAFFLKQWGDWIAAAPDQTGYNEVLGSPVATIDGKIYDAENVIIWAQTGGLMARVGKKIAGRLLDGKQHDGYPK